MEIKIRVNGTELQLQGWNKMAKKKRKLTKYQKCMGIELKKAGLKGKTKAERKSIFKKTAQRCKA